MDGGKGSVSGGPGDETQQRFLPASFSSKKIQAPALASITWKQSSKAISQL